MERRLRQGDPLSPFLFVLVVDVLHRMIGEAVRNGRISPMLVGTDSIELFHLQFADDTILFCPPEEDVYVIGVYGGVSADQISGYSLGANPKRVKTWKPVIDKVEEKLSLWKAKVLNKAGKLVLIKSVLSSLPIYYLSLYKMPKSVAEKLISLQRQFLWSSDGGKQGLPLVKWEVIMAPKKEGGLGVGDAVIRNTALLFKWWWRFSREDYPLWKKVVCSCTNIDPAVMIRDQPVPTRGGFWKDICQLQVCEPRLREKMISGLAMELGNGRTIRFWEDSWLPNGALKDKFPRLFSVSTLHGAVIGDCGFWDGLEWIWSFQWRRELFQWELDLTMQAEVLPDEITSYSFMRAIWKGFVPPRIELLSWCGVPGCLRLVGVGARPVLSRTTSKAGRPWQYGRLREKGGSLAPAQASLSSQPDIIVAAELVAAVTTSATIATRRLSPSPDTKLPAKLLSAVASRCFELLVDG
nr:uncharacterized protein LOC114925980 [Arachis hypogaea]